MLNTCPALKSCGGIDGYWTDEPMPRKAGVLETVWVYGSHGDDDCKNHKEVLEVIRCSWRTDYDFVYRFSPSNANYNITPSGNPSESCPDVFCGML